MTMKTAVIRTGTVLYHGTDAPEEFTVPRPGPVWFADTFDVAARWAGWRRHETPGPRRVLTFIVGRGITVLDTVAYKDYVRVCRKLCGYDEPLIMEIAEAVVNGGHGGWLGKGEIMLGDMTALSFEEFKLVPVGVASFGD